MNRILVKTELPSQVHLDVESDDETPENSASDQTRSRQVSEDVESDSESENELFLQNNFDTLDETGDNIESDDDEDNDETLVEPRNTFNHPVFHSEARYNKLNWKQCDTSTNLTPLQKVEIKEKAVVDGIRSIKNFASSLKAAEADVPSTFTQPWQRKIQNILQNRKQCQTTIGFLGVTGAGKSSLINALLEYEDLLPVDDGKACTAVCVKIMYNRDDDPRYAFRARIVFINKQEWRAEVKSLLEDVHEDSNNTDGDDGEIDTERNERIKVALSKIKFVYPKIKQKQDLLQYTIDDLMADQNVCSVLGSKKDFVSSNLELFAAKIKPYIDSNNASEKPCFASWPLVKMVRLDVKSQILKDGICLVDLPGTHDTNSARGRIAANAQSNLTLTCVVAPSTRASSDKPAQDLLGEVRQRTMLLDNHYSSDRLCFIISKSDDSINLERYIKNRPYLKADLALELEKEVEVCKRLEEAQRRHLLEVEQSEKLAEEISVMEQKINEFRTQQKETKIKSQTPKKRKAEEITEEASEEVDNSAELEAIKEKWTHLKSNIEQKQKDKGLVDSRILQWQKKVASLGTWLQKCESRKTAACIKHRGTSSADEIRTDFNSVLSSADGKKTSSSPTKENLSETDTEKSLQVFSVSSKAFMDVRRGNSLNGFTALDDTGIPKVHQWLVESTLARRKIESEATLESILSFQIAIAPLLETNAVGRKFSRATRIQLDNILNSNLTLLRKELTTNSNDLAQSCMNIAENGLLKKLAQVEAVAELKAEAIVRGWASKPTTWSTHRAINKAFGIFRNSKGLEFNWPAQLAGPYLDALIATWRSVIHQEIPIKVRHEEEILKCIVEYFTDSVLEQCHSICPEISDQLEGWAESTLRELPSISKTYDRIYETAIKRSARHAHPQVTSKLQELWWNVFSSCGEAKGTGHYQRNQKVHINHVRRIQCSMYKKSSRLIQQEFRSLWETLSDGFDQDMVPVTDFLAKNFAMLLDIHTKRSESNNRAAIFKQKLQQEWLKNVTKLLADWKTEIEFDVPVKVKVEVEDDSLPPIDDLILPQIIVLDDEDEF